MLRCSILDAILKSKLNNYFYFIVPESQHCTKLSEYGILREDNAAGVKIAPCPPPAWLLRALLYGNAYVANK